MGVSQCVTTHIYGQPICCICLKEKLPFTWNANKISAAELFKV